MSCTRSEEDAVLDRLLTHDGVFAIEWQFARSGFRAYYMQHGKELNEHGTDYSSVVGRTPSAAYRAAQELETAARVAAKLGT